MTATATTIESAFWPDISLSVLPSEEAYVATKGAQRARVHFAGHPPVERIQPAVLAFVVVALGGFLAASSSGTQLSQLTRHLFCPNGNITCYGEHFNSFNAELIVAGADAEPICTQHVGICRPASAGGRLLCLRGNALPDTHCFNSGPLSLQCHRLGCQHLDKERLCSNLGHKIYFDFLRFGCTWCLFSGRLMWCPFLWGPNPRWRQHQHLGRSAWQGGVGRGRAMCPSYTQPPQNHHPERLRGLPIQLGLAGGAGEGVRGTSSLSP